VAFNGPPDCSEVCGATFLWQSPQNDASNGGMRCEGEACTQADTVDGVRHTMANVRVYIIMANIDDVAEYHPRTRVERPWLSLHN